jgi:SnoaL-like domain
MPSSDTLERFIARVEQNAHVEAIEEFYTENASMQENQAAPRVGRDTLVANERKALERARSVRSTCVRPAFVDGDRVVIRWIFEFIWKDGSASRIEELAWQRWEGERIAQEQFFYDPRQFTPTPPLPDGNDPALVRAQSTAK